MLAMMACPARGDMVTPSDSNFGQVTMIPTRRSLGFALVFAWEIGHASNPVAGSI